MAMRRQVQPVKLGEAIGRLIVAAVWLVILASSIALIPLAVIAELADLGRRSCDPRLH